MKSSIFSLNWKDLAKGLVVAVLGAVLGIITVSIQAGSLSFDWAAILKTATLTAAAYLLKNLVTNNNDEILKKDA